MSRRKKADRGWDQAEVIAKELSRASGIPCDFSLLARKKPKEDQHDLSAAERALAAKQQYHIAAKPGNIEGRHIILTDDVLTTGATLSACAALLLSLGAADVTAAAICRTILKAKAKQSRQ